LLFGGQLRADAAVDVWLLCLLWLLRRFLARGLGAGEGLHA
jgi:hypothetical protein